MLFMSPTTIKPIKGLFFFAYLPPTIKTASPQCPYSNAKYIAGVFVPTICVWTLQARLQGFSCCFYSSVCGRVVPAGIRALTTTMMTWYTIIERGEYYEQRQTSADYIRC